MATLQEELEANFRSLQAEGDALNAQSKALDIRIQGAYRRLTEAEENGDNAAWGRIDDEITELEKEYKKMCKQAIHALNIANEALVVWQKAVSIAEKENK